MISYALILRSADGMPLTASVEMDNQPQVRDAKRILKLLGKKAKRFPDRCSLHVSTKLSIHFTTSLGVTYLALCEKTYPIVLAFSFLDELVKEFITVYTTQDVNLALRPYSFIQFDNVIQKTRQRYNNPSSLATKVNLSDLSLEIKLRPPMQLRLDDIEPAIVNGVNSLSSMNSVGPSRLPPISWIGFTTMLFTIFCALFNFVRGISALSESSFEDYDGTSPFHGFMFLIETLAQSFQLFLLVNTMLRRKLLWTAVSFLTICICNMLVWDVRDLWQIIFHVGLAAQMTFCIVFRKPRRKAPNYNV